MKANWLGAMIVAALLAVACGEGRVIFNVDVYSFMAGTGDDTLRYPPLPVPNIPSGSPPITVQSESVKVVLAPGFENSVVQSAHVVGILDLDNATGTGSVTVDVFLSADSSMVFTGTPAFGFGGTVTPATVTKDTVDVDLLSTFNSLFTGKAVWLGFRANVTNTGATGMQGTIRLRALDLRVIVQEDVF